MKMWYFSHDKEENSSLCNNINKDIMLSEISQTEKDK